MKVHPDLSDFYWYPYQMHGFSSNIYAIDQGDEMWLVDCGTSRFHFFKSFLSAFKKDGLNPSKITKIFFTHAHPDHCSAAHKLQNLCSPTFFISEKEYEWFFNAPNPSLKDRANQSGTSQNAHENNSFDGFWRSQADAAGEYWEILFPLPNKLLTSLTALQMGSLPLLNEKLQKIQTNEAEKTKIRGTKYEMEVIPTPGHSPGHLSFYFPQAQFLIAGDIFGRIPNKPVLNLPTAEFSSYKSSIVKLKQYPVSSWGTGHGKTIGKGTDQFSEMRDRTLENLLRVEEIGKNISELNDRNDEKNIEKEFIIKKIENLSKEILQKFGKSPWKAFERKMVAFSILKEKITNKLQ